MNQNHWNNCCASCGVYAVVTQARRCAKKCKKRSPEEALGWNRINALSKGETPNHLLVSFDSKSITPLVLLLLLLVPAVVSGRTSNYRNDIEQVCCGATVGWRRGEGGATNPVAWLWNLTMLLEKRSSTRAAPNFLHVRKIAAAE
jgi:hypothetical protein